MTTVEIDLLDDEFRRDPWPVFRRLHEGPEIVQDARFGAYHAVSSAAARAVLSRTQTYVSALRQPAEKGMYGARTMIFSDGADHRMLRRSFAPLLSPRRLAEVEHRVELAVDSLLATAVGGGSFDAMELICRPLPVMTICELLGLDLAHWPELQEASDAIVALSDGADGARTRRLLARWMQDYFRDFVSGSRSRDPEVAALLGSMDLEPDEVAAGAMLLLIAGHETTAGLLGNLLALLGTDGAARTALADPATDLEAFVDEVLRFVGPVQALRRIAAVEDDVAGVSIPAGATVVVLLGCANRDPRVHDAPDVFRVDRADEPGHLAFGHGPHLCLGARLARLETMALLERFVERSLDVEPHQDAVEYVRSVFVRGPRRLPISLRSAHTRTRT